jgi:hypothetical protein
MVWGMPHCQNAAASARTCGDARRSEDRENGALAFRPPMIGGGNCTQNKKLSESDEVGEFGLGSVWTRICRSRNTLSRPTGMRHPYHLLRTRLGFAICHVVEDSYPSSELSLFRTRLERTRISRTGTNGEDSAVANCVVVRLMPWLTGDHFPSAIAGSHPRRGSPGVTM